jgi:predicted DNA binding protein
MAQNDEEHLDRLSQDERAALYTALDQGYFDTPRQVPLTELADELDTTDVELSKRLRQGISTVIGRYRDQVDEPVDDL